jgi:arsenite-transporting ATPase
MVVRETQRAYMYFSLYGVTTDRVIINRLFPASEGYFSRWATTQTTYAAEIRDYFAPVPVSTLPLFADEVVGQARLREVAEALYQDEDPTQGSLEAPPYAFTKEGEHYRLELTLPFVQKEEIDITRQREDLVIRVGSFKRYVPLPRAIARLKTAGAKMEGSRLIVQFGAEGSP